MPGQDRIPDRAVLGRAILHDVGVDATGLVLAPGFIDAHTHDDRAVVDTPDLVAKISQGVTTVSKDASVNGARSASPNTR